MSVATESTGPKAEYHVRRREESWHVEHDGELSQAYVSKEAAFEAAAAAANLAIAEGYAVVLTVEGGMGGRFV